MDGATTSPPTRPIDLREAGASTAKVLVVDDDKPGSAQVAKMIEKLGHEALLAHAWTQALQLFTAHEFDLVLMEAVMPSVDGYKLTRILRERSGSYVPIVFVTGLSNATARRRAVDAGADDIIQKPVDETELSIRLVSMLRIRRLTKALEDKSEVLARAARYDGLTDLLNRRSLDERLPEEVARARRYGRDLTLMMVDVDHFKNINDTRGHDGGDEVLRTLARVLRSCARATDLVYRYGGEEFLILATETPAAGAVRLAERVRAAFAAATGETMSVGVASLSQLAANVDGSALRNTADAALYAAKKAGRDRVCVHGDASGD